MVLSFVNGTHRAPELGDQPRLSRYQEMRDFYEGVQWLGKPQRGKNRQTYNYARRMVRAAISYMFAAPVGFNVPASESGEDEAAARLAERVLADYLGHIGADELDVQLAEDAAVAGDAVAKITWDSEARLPVLTAVDAGQVRVEARPDQPRVPLAWEHWYQMRADELAAALPAARAAILRAEPLERSAPRKRVVERWTDAELVVTFAGAEVYRDTNPYGWMPYVAVSFNPGARRFWGRSDLEDLIDVCRQLNKRLAVGADVLDLAGYPIAVLENVDGSEGITVGPGAKWELPEDSKAYLLDLLSGGGVEFHATYIDQIRRTLHDLAETPRTAFGDTGRTISGAALEVEIQPLAQKVRRHRGSFNTYYRQRNARMLDLAERFGGHAIGGIRRAIPVWPDILPSDADAEAARLAQLTGSDNLSHRTAMADWGIEDPEGEWLRVLEERSGIHATEPRPAPDDASGGEAGA